VFLAITIFSIGNTALLNYLMGSRLLYGMSRQKLLPSVFGRIHPVRRTPHIAVLTLFFIVTLLILSGGVKQLAESTVLLLLGVFTIVNVALIFLKLRKDEPKGQFEVPLVVPVLGALVCLILIGVRVAAAFSSVNPASKTAPLVSGAVVLLALVLYAVIRPKKVPGEISAEED